MAALLLPALVLLVLPAAQAGAQSVSPATASVASPGDADTQPAAFLGAVSCTSFGNCVGVGGYVSDAGVNRWSMTAVETKGTWGQSTRLALPADAATKGQFSSSTGVSCSSASSCVLTGYYVDTLGHTVPMQASGTGDSWNRATRLSVPADAATATNPEVTPENMSCTAAGECVWVGYYIDGSGAHQAVQGTEHDGTWGPTTKIAAPVDAASNPSAVLWDASCTSVGNCIAVGRYSDTSGSTQAMQAVETGGVWARAIRVSVPSDAASNPGAEISSVSCQPSGDCVEVGDYTDGTGGQSMLATKPAGGTWGQLAKVPAPAGAGSNPGSFLQYVACTSPGDCVGVGGYNNSSGTLQAMQISEKDGVWGQLTKIATPADAAADALALVEYVTCRAAGDCVGVGFYADKNGNGQAMATTTLADSTPPVITSSVSPATPDGANGWYQGSPTISFTVGDPESTISDRTGCDKTTVSTDGAGQTFTCSATSVGGTSSSTVTLNRDSIKPTVNFDTGGVADSGSYTWGSTPAAPTCTATDATSGVDASGCAVSGYSTALGDHTLSATATDNAGNTSTVTRSYTVTSWRTNGFYQPVDMSGVYNTVKGGATVPVKFNLYAGTTQVTDPSKVSFSAAKASCLTGTPTDAIEVTTTGATSLRYDTTAGQFVYNWQTPKAAGSCYQLTMTSADGSKTNALFQLK